MRATPAANLAHLVGAAIASANLLTRATGADQVAAVQAAGPGRFTWFASADVGQLASMDALTQAVKAGARGFGEMKFHYATDGPEFKRAYALLYALALTSHSRLPMLRAWIQRARHAKHRARATAEILKLLQQSRLGSF